MTKYHVLSVSSEGALSLVGKDVAANSAEAAVRAYALKINTVSASGMYVAIPVRSWKPVTVAVETQTRIRIGGEE